MKYIPLLMISFQVFANSGADLLTGGSKKFETQINKVYKAPRLDNVFVVQAYGAYRALGVDQSTREYFDSFFAGDNMDSLSLSMTLRPRTEAQRRLIAATTMYSYWKLELFHSFFISWKNESLNYDFANTELGVALDQLIGNDVSKRIVENGLVLTSEETKKIKEVKQQDSLTNTSIQAYISLNDGVESIDLVSKLAVNDPLFIPLAKTVIVDLAGRGELAAAAKVIKEKIEPRIALESEKDIVSDYYILLARLLYQAKAYDASYEYYSLIPDTSKYYMTAQSERMWNTFMIKDYARLLGEYKTLSLNEFQHFFMPDTHVLGAMANLKLCFFEDVQNSFNLYIQSNKLYARKIEDYMSGKTQTRLNNDAHFKIDQMNLYSVTVNSEIERLKVMFGRKGATHLNDRRFDDLIKSSIKKEVLAEYTNAKTMLEASLRRMRFAKIEFLSTMRRLKDQLATTNNQDHLKFIESGLDKSKKLIFPYDGVLFGDELFHYNSRVKKLCQAGLK